jgi:hypothetical protein
MRRRAALATVGMSVVSSAPAQILHLYESPSERIFGFALPVLLAVWFLWYLIAKGRSKAVGVSLAFAFVAAVVLGYFLLAISGGLFALYLPAFLWSMAFIALLAVGWEIASRRDAVARAVRERDPVPRSTNQDVA